MDTPDVTCDAAIEEFRSILKAPGATLPDGWKLDAQNRMFTSEDGDEFRVALRSPRGR